MPIILVSTIGCIGGCNRLYYKSKQNQVLKTNVQQASGASITNLYADREYKEIPLNGMRKTVAARLTEAKQNIPHFYLRKEIKIEDARKEYQKLITAGWQVTEPKW